MSQPFVKANVDRAPESAGVYTLYDASGTVIYYGRAQGGSVTIRSRLQDHLAGRAGACTQGASRFDYEVTDNSVAREKELLEAFKKANNGNLPKCNERVG